MRGERARPNDARDENLVGVGGRVAGVRGQGPRGGLERDQPPQSRPTHRERGFVGQRRDHDGPPPPPPSNRARQTYETGREREPNSPNGRQISIPGRGYGSEQLDVPRFSRRGRRGRGGEKGRDCSPRPWGRSGRQRVADNAGERGREEGRKR